MGKNRFVQPEVVRLELSEGDWIDVKKRLTVGEERKAFQSVVGEVNPEGWRRPNVEMVGVSEMVAYIVRWSLRDAQDIPVPVSADTIKGLEIDDFKEIEKAIERHVAAVEAEAQALKNAKAVVGTTS
jgi:hypothetical protein